MNLEHLTSEEREALLHSLDAGEELRWSERAIPSLSAPQFWINLIFSSLGNIFFACVAAYIIIEFCDNLLYLSPIALFLGYTALAPKRYLNGLRKSAYALTTSHVYVLFEGQVVQRIALSLKMVEYAYCNSKGIGNIEFKQTQETPRRQQYRLFYHFKPMAAWLSIHHVIKLQSLIEKLAAGDTQAQLCELEEGEKILYHCDALPSKHHTGAKSMMIFGFTWCAFSEALGIGSLLLGAPWYFCAFTQIFTAIGIYCIFHGLLHQKRMERTRYVLTSERIYLMRRGKEGPPYHVLASFRLAADVVKESIRFADGSGEIYLFMRDKNVALHFNSDETLYNIPNVDEFLEAIEGAIQERL